MRLRISVIVLMVSLLTILIASSTLGQVSIESGDNANYPQSIYNLTIDQDYLEYDKEYQWFSNDDTIPGATLSELNCRLCWLDECKAYNQIYAKVRYYINGDWTDWEKSNIVIIQEIKFDARAMTCETGEPQLVYGRYMCVIEGSTIETGIDKEYIRVFDISIKNLGSIIWPSEPVFGWIGLGVLIIILLKCLNITGKKVLKKIGLG